MELKRRTEMIQLWIKRWTSKFN